MKGKQVPGKNLSKNSQVDGNDEEPGTSKKSARQNSRQAAQAARESIAHQTQLIDIQMPDGDKPYKPESESNSDDESESEQEDEEGEHDDSNENESMDDDFQSAQSFQQDLSDLGDTKEHCWVETFDLELNSKRIDAFQIASKCDLLTNNKR